MMVLHEATAADIAYVRANLRASARQDLADAAGGALAADFGAGFDFCLEVSRTVLAIVTDDGRCAGIGSTCPDPYHAATGFVWFMGTDAIHAAERDFLRLTRAAIRRFYELEAWDALLTFVSSNNPRSLRWMTRWLHFDHVGTVDGYAQSVIPYHKLTHARAALVRYPSYGSDTASAPFSVA